MRLLSLQKSMLGLDDTAKKRKRKERGRTRAGRLKAGMVGYTAAVGPSSAVFR